MCTFKIEITLVQLCVCYDLNSREGELARNGAAFINLESV